MFPVFSFLFAVENMSTYQSFRDFEVYLKGRTLAFNVWKVAKNGNFGRDYGLANQITRAADSIPSNFAEGFEREGRKEFIQFIGYAKGSCGEVRAQLDLALDRGHISACQHGSLDQEAHDITKMLKGLGEYLKQSDYSGLKYKQETGNRKLETWDPPLRIKNDGAALITILLILTVLTVMAIGFLHSMRIDRLTARAYLHKTRADFMVDAGLAAACHRLAESTADPAHITLHVPGPAGSPYAFIGQTNTHTTTPGLVAYQPLFSGGQPNVSDRLPAIVLDPARATAQIPTVFSEDSDGIAAVSWIPFHPGQESNPPKATGRFAFWMEDLEGYLNPVAHGNSAGTNQTHLRQAGSHPDEIALFTLFDPSIPFEQASPTADSLALVTQRVGLLFTPILPRLVSHPKSSHLVAGLRYDTAERPRIPHGFGYADAGKTKHNLNALIAQGGDAAVNRIERIIRSNLPVFAATRKGGLSGFDYNRQLAASIIDYADTDTAPTAKPGVYRGIDAFPFIHLVFDRIAWVSGNGLADNPVRLVVQTFVDVWNPHTLPISGEVSLTNINTFGVVVGGPQSFATEVHPATPLQLRPNGHAVLKAGETTYTFVNGTGVLAVGSPLLWSGSRDDHRVELYWDQRLVDTFGGGAQRSGDGILHSGESQRKYKGNAPCLDYSLGQVGDPRASWFVTASTYPRNYDGSTAWGGRQFAAGIADANHKEVVFSRWPDPAHDGPTEPANTHPATLTGSDASQAALENPPPVGLIPQNGRGTWRGFGNGTLPTAIPLPAAEPHLAFSMISNTGKLSTITELGHVYDPAQWQDIARPGATPSSSAGGGFTLRIGQAEFPAFDQPGSRAWQLLDLFDTETTTDTTGRINLNTAGRDTLRALVTGIVSSRDPLLQPASLRHSLASPSRQEAGDIFADAVIAARPFLSPAQLSQLKTGDEAYFGNPGQWDSGAPRLWNDAAREEAFSRIYRLCSTRGKNYRIYVVGQALEPNGRVRATSRKCFQVYLKPHPDALQPPTLKHIYETSF